MADVNGPEPAHEQVVLSDDAAKKNNRTAWLIQAVFLAIVVGFFVAVGIGFATGK